MNNSETVQKYDLEARTTAFGREVVRVCRSVSKDSINSRICGQLVGSAGSVGANYREANDALGKKDFLLRLKTARKEAKETLHWLELLEEANDGISVKTLKNEANELKNILSAIIIKSQG